ADWIRSLVWLMAKIGRPGEKAAIIAGMGERLTCLFYGLYKSTTRHANGSILGGTCLQCYSSPLVRPVRAKCLRSEDERPRVRLHCKEFK
ncbi:hypothetical protein AO269_29885, partial [Pseudomonas putida]